MQHLAERGKPSTHERLVEELGLDEDGNEGLRRRLNAMVRDGQLIRNRRDGYGPVGKMDLVRGRVVGHPDGYGFVIPDEGGDDLYLSSRQMRGLMHGDRAVFRVSGVDHRGRKEGAMVEVLERNTKQVVGRFFMEGGIGIVVPDNQRVQHDILIPAEFQGDAEPGQIVVADLVDQPSKRAKPMGQVVEILGDHMGPGMEIDIAIRSHGLHFVWPDGVEDESHAFGREVPRATKEGRVDLRDIPLVTIDGADAKDFDDAVYCERKPKGWRLLVAIADVSAYVKPGTALDEEAKIRGTSAYFPGRVVPMLPEILSNGLCSLNPQVDRLCLVCEMYVNRDGEVTRSRFFEGVMRSAARLTYEEVSAMLVEGDERVRNSYSGLLPHLQELYAIYHELHRARINRGAIDFETKEARIVFGMGKKIERIELAERNDAHKVIEECMVAANVSAARFLLRKKVPALYRVHELPTKDKLEVLREFLGGLGLRLKGGKQPKPGDYAELLGRVADRPDAHLIQTVLLRSMAQAVYSPDNIGHFGLAHQAYTHFTSPIRRYPDLLVHRAIRHLLHRGKPGDFIYSPGEMVSLGENCSACERRADDATRDAVAWLKCEYMQDKVGDEFEGTITAVTSFGVFVELDGVFVEGLVHVTALKSDYYHFEPGRHLLQGERSGKTYRLADRIRVRVVRVDLDEQKTDFEPAQ
ncbi:MAG: ribonuclease R [Gammaproteobacteria bacterium]|nr:ribonuclease R [Gammaproteobacteria bacterium]